jgi:hypothetical protein
MTGRRHEPSGASVRSVRAAGRSADDADLRGIGDGSHPNPLAHAVNTATRSHMVTLYAVATSVLANSMDLRFP